VIIEKKKEKEKKKKKIIVNFLFLAHTIILHYIIPVKSYRNISCHTILHNTTTSSLFLLGII